LETFVRGTVSVIILFLHDMLLILLQGINNIGQKQLSFKAFKSCQCSSVCSSKF